MHLPEAAAGATDRGGQGTLHRSFPQRDDRGSMEGHRGRPAGRMSDDPPGGESCGREPDRFSRLSYAIASGCGNVDHEPVRPQRRTYMTPVSELRVKIYADGADLQGMMEMSRHPWIKGFTTNPTLMRKAGVTDYRTFAMNALKAIPDRPISFEVFSDEFEEMAYQAREIATWGGHVYVKIPVSNTRRESSIDLIHALTVAGIKVNVTAVLALDQVRDVVAALVGGSPAYVSVFAGRVADTGRDPVPLMAAAVELLACAPNAELIWASPRELLNIFQADAIGCHIITVTNDILKKLDLVGRDLHEYSLDTVMMFRSDAVRAGYTLPARAGSKA